MKGLVFVPKGLVQQLQLLVVAVEEGDFGLEARDFGSVLSQTANHEFVKRDH